MVSKKIILGFILIVLTATTITIMLQEQVGIKVTGTSSTFYVMENGTWISSGVESNKLYNGTKLISTNVVRSINISISGNMTTITRIASYQTGTIIKDTYLFDGSVNDKERFPISHIIEVVNGTGLIYEYYISGLSYQGPTAKINRTSMSFGHNMKIVFDSGYISANIYKSGYMRIRYAIKSDDENYSLRLFDPSIFPKDISYKIHAVRYAMINMSVVAEENLTCDFIEQAQEADEMCFIAVDSFDIPVENSFNKGDANVAVMKSNRPDKEESTITLESFNVGDIINITLGPNHDNPNYRYSLIVNSPKTFVVSSPELDKASSVGSNISYSMKAAEGKQEISFTVGDAP